MFERLAANVDLRITLEAITEVTERVSPDTVCALRLLDENGVHLNLCAGPRLPAEYARASGTIAVAVRNGSCAAAVYLQRQVIVADIARDALWENMRDVVLAAGLRSCWSTLIHASDGRILGTLALYFKTPRSPVRRDFELMARMTQLAGIAIERRMSRRRIASQRGALSPAVRQRDGRRLQLDARRPIPVGQSRAGAHGRVLIAGGAARAGAGDDLSQPARARRNHRGAGTRRRDPQRRVPAATRRRHGR